MSAGGIAPVSRIRTAAASTLFIADPERRRIIRCRLSNSAGVLGLRRLPPWHHAPFRGEMDMLTTRIAPSFIALVFVIALGGVLLTSQEKGGGAETGEYEVVAGWPQNYC